MKRTLLIKAVLLTLLATGGASAQSFQPATWIVPTGRVLGMDVGPEGNIYVGGRDRNYGADWPGRVLPVNWHSIAFLASFNADGELLWSRPGFNLDGRMAGSDRHIMDVHEIVAHGNRLFTNEGLIVSISVITSDWDTRGGVMTGVYSLGGDSLATLFFGQRDSTAQNIDLIDPAGFIRGLELDAAGNLYIAGKFLDTLRVAPGTELLPREPEERLNQHVALVSYAPDGELRWAQRIAGTKTQGEWHERITRGGLINACFTVDDLGNAHLCGFFRKGSVFGEGQPDSVLFTENARAIAAFDADGDLQWVRTTTELGVFGNDIGLWTLAADNKGGFAALWHGLRDPGRPSGFFTFGDTTFVRQQGANGYLNVLAKHAADGSIVWVRQIETESGPLTFTDLVMDRRGHVYVAGSHWGQWLKVEGQLFVDEHKTDLHSGGTGFVLHYDTDGLLVRVLYVPGVGYHSTVHAVALGESDELYVAGYMEDRREVVRPYVLGLDTLSSDARLLPFLARYEYTSTNVENAPELPSSGIRVLQYPNPFTDATTIGFELPTETHVRLRVYDLLGREIATLVDDFRHGGQHRAVFRKEGLPSGTYVYRLEAMGKVQLGRMVLVR
ncbi:MAG: T9SS type A sorting domain-containing protein [Bacteroidota bacterium]|nr:T9SS type A sorting domain-containing protein [Bacteroidota bacterium]